MTDEPRPEDQATSTGTPAQEPATPTAVADAASGEHEHEHDHAHEHQHEQESEEKKPVKLKQTVEMRDVGPCKKHIKVTVDREAIDERFKEKFSELVKSSNVSGFRPGKAPRRVIERRFAKEVGGQVKGEVLYASLEQLAEEQDIAPLSTPELNPDQIEIPQEGPFVYEFEVEVRPQFDLPPYKGLELKRPVHTFTPDEVAQEQRRLLTPYGQIVPKPEGNVQVGDIVVADVTFMRGDQVISTAKELSFRVEKQLAFKDGVAPRFGEQVAGANAGDLRSVDVTLSSTAAEPSLRGQAVQMMLEIKDVKTVRLPELTHEFLHNFHVHSEEQFRELVQVVLNRRLEYQQRQSAREQVMQQIAAASTWELPQDLLMRQARKALNRRVMEMRADGIPEEEIQGRVRLLQQNVLQSTAMALKEHFVLQKIAEVEKIEVSEEDLDAEIDRLAEQEDESPRRIRARLEKEDMLDALAAEMVERKVLDLILESAQYEDVPIGEEPQTAVATVEEQAVPGAMRDLEAEAAQVQEATKKEEAAPPTA
jgi:trigger factor